MTWTCCSILPIALRNKHASAYVQYYIIDILYSFAVISPSMNSNETINFSVKIFAHHKSVILISQTKKSWRKWQENSPFSWMIGILCQSDEKTIFSNLPKSTFLFLHQGYCECGILRQSPHQLQECAVGVGPQPVVAKSSSEKTDPAKPGHLARHCSRPAYSHQGMQMAVS